MSAVTEVTAATTAAAAPDAPSDRAFTAAQDFLLGTKTFWTTRMFPALRAEYEERAQQGSAKTGAPEAARTVPQHAGTAAAAGAVAVATTLQESTLYQTFAWLERHLQRMKYSGRYGLVNWHARDRTQLEASIADAPAVLDPALALPRYYVSVDIHQHPGGVWGDALAGAVYERGARSTTPLAGQQHSDLHERFTQQVAHLFAMGHARNQGTGPGPDAGAAATRTSASPASESPLRAPQAILDMGCGFGKSTLPFARTFDNARIEAIDLAAPCLRLAAKTQRDAGLHTPRFAQVNAAQTPYGANEFDLVTSTMLLHELPPPMVENVLRESARVLKPGGWMVHLDFLPQVQPRADAFAHFIHYGHGRRNNEPFMEPLAHMDLAVLLAGLGFNEIALEPFEEAPGALDAANPNWRFPWAMIRARKAVA